MSTTPATLSALRSYLMPLTGLKAVSLGVVGNQKHCGGYHLGRDRIYGACACKPKGTCVPGRGNDDYSVKTARDRSGLSNAAMALDIGNFAGLRDLSVWLVKQGQANAPGTSDIREVIYTDDGKRVLRWDRERGYATGPRTGEADDSHLTHTHISWYRDSERRDKVALFRRYFEGEEPMGTKVDIRGDPIGVAALKPDARLRRISDDVVIALPANVTARNVYATATWRDTKSTGYVVTYQGEAHLLPESDVAVYTPLAAGPRDVPVSVTVGGQTFNHTVRIV